MDRFFGSLSVEEGSIVFEPGGRVNRNMNSNIVSRVVHTSPDVVLVRARLLPPNLNSSLILNGDSSCGEDVSAAVQMPAWTRRQLLPALVEAGFRVDERATWLSLGGTGSRSELPPGNS